MDASAKAIASQWANHLPQQSLQMAGIYAKNGGFDNRHSRNSHLETITGNCVWYKA